MEFLKKLFGKKKHEEKREAHVTAEKATADKIKEEDARDITLEEVEKELNDISVAHANDKPGSSRPEERAETQAIAERTEKETELKEAQAKEAQGTVYHIKKHDDGWQIIADGADRALRVFGTQKEAIDHAKEKELEYLLYRADGTLRK